MWWLLWIAIGLFAYLLIGLCVATLNYVIEGGYRDDDWVAFDTIAWPAILAIVIGFGMSMIVKSAGNRILKWRGE